jgi:CelD/BcsL family acetyltransferase involved in cellulose biosynthesis
MSIAIRLLHPADLTETDLNAWKALQQANAALDSPFFCPEFTRAIAGYRQDVEIGLLERADGAPIGFFPFHRQGRDVGRPVGLGLSDMHGVICGDDLNWRADQLLRGCRLRSWHFDHLPTVQTPFAEFCGAEADSPYLDLAVGYDGYVRKQRQTGSSLIPQILRKARKFAREVGPLRTEFHTSDSAVFEKLLAWKSEQRARTGTYDVLTEPWVIGVLDHIRQWQSPGFAGVVSVLYAGDQLAAVHFGMRSSTVLHYWFPTYHSAYEKFSPGLILLLDLAKLSAERGIMRIDLGKGSERYKMILMSGSFPLSEGWVGGGAGTRLLKGSWFRLRDAVRASPLHRPATQTKRALRRLLRPAIQRIRANKPW